MPIVAGNIEGNPDSIEDGVTGALVAPSLALSTPELCLPAEKIPEHVFGGKTRRVEVPKALPPNDLVVVVEDLFQKPDKLAKMRDSMKQRVKSRFAMENTTSSFLKLTKEWTLDKALNKYPYFVALY